MTFSPWHEQTPSSLFELGPAVSTIGPRPSEVPSHSCSSVLKFSGCLAMSHLMDYWIDQLGGTWKAWDLVLSVPFPFGLICMVLAVVGDGGTALGAFLSSFTCPSLS